MFCHSSAQVHCYKVCKCAATLKLLGWGEYWWLQAYGVQPLFCGYFASEFSTQAPYSVAISWYKKNYHFSLWTFSVERLSLLSCSHTDISSMICPQTQVYRAIEWHKQKTALISLLTQTLSSSTPPDKGSSVASFFPAISLYQKVKKVAPKCLEPRGEDPQWKQLCRYFECQTHSCDLISRMSFFVSSVHVISV